MNTVVISLAELVLKGKNRHLFEKQLIDNIKAKLPAAKIQSLQGRIILESEENRSDIKDGLNHTFGIAKFSFCQRAENSVEALSTKCLEFIKKEGAATFAVRTHYLKPEKSISRTQTNINVGQYIVDHSKLKVDLSQPDITCHIYISKDYALVTCSIHTGLHGLPTNVSGNMVALLSGGFDSPVASHMMMSRGVKLIFTHFHSYPQTSRQSIEKVKKITAKLADYQGVSKLYLIPFLEMQKEIAAQCQNQYLVLLYRRAMLRIANNIAIKHKALGIVSGDSLAQVASQTQENIFCQNQASELPVYRPLIGHDKLYILDHARKIDTYDISKQPHDDSCSLFLPKSPKTKARLDGILAEEEIINEYQVHLDKMINEARIITVNPSKRMV